MIKKIIILKFLFYFTFCYLFSQSENPDLVLPVTQYGAEAGLRQSMVTKIFQDSQGIIWVLTGDGLHYYDGENFSAIKIPTDSIFDISDQCMYRIKELDNKKFLLSTISSICTYDLEESKFENIHRKNRLYPILFEAQMWNFSLCWCYDKGVCLIYKKNIIPIRIQNIDKYENPDDTVPQQIFINQNKSLIIRYPHAIAEVPFENWSTSLNWKPKFYSFPEGVQLIANLKNCEIIGFFGNKLCKYHGNGQLQILANKIVQFPRCLYEDYEHNIWVSDIATNQLLAFKNGEFKQIQMIDVKNNDTLKPYIIDIFEDNNNNLWFGTDGDGLIFYERKFHPFKKFSTGFVRSITEFNNHIWVGTFKNGLWKMDKNLNTGKKIISSQYNESANIFSLATDDKGRLWIASSDGVCAIDKNENIIFNYPINLNYAFLWHFAKDTMLLSHEGILYHFNCNNHPHFTDTSIFTVINNVVMHQHKYYIGTGFGLVIAPDKTRIPDANNPFHYFINSLNIKSLLIHNNQIWTSTNTGLQIFDLKENPVPKPDFLDPLQNEIIYCLKEDEQKRIWFSSNMGIGCIDEDNKKIHWLQNEYNLQSLEFNSNAHFTDNEGNLYFGGINGINKVIPSTFNPLQNGREPVLIHFKIHDSSYKKGILPTGNYLQLSYTNNHISGTITCNAFSALSKRKYSFYLKNWDKQWSIPSKDNTFRYSNLAPGHYALYAKCADAYQNWGKEKLLIQFYITPPFWKTWWFIASMLIIALYLIYISIRYLQKIKFIKKIKELEHQNALEKERNRISKDLHDELGSGLSLIMMITDLENSKNNDPVKIKELLNGINTHARELYDNMNNLIWLLNNENQNAEALFSRIREIIGDILEQAEIDYQILFPDNPPQYVFSREASRNIYLIIKEAINNVLKHANATEVTLCIQLNHETLTGFVKDNGTGIVQKSLGSGGNGVKNMKNRAKSLGGNIEILKNGNESGMCVNFSFPINQIIEKN